MQSTLFQNLKKFDSAIAVVDDYGSAFTYSELDHDVEKMLAFLLPGRVAVCVATNSYSFLVCYIAFIKSGVVPILLSGDTTNDELMGVASKYKAKYICNPLNGYIYNSDYEFLVGNQTYGIHRLINGDFQAEKNLSLLLTTSGTTGIPQLVRLSNSNIKSNSDSIIEYLNLTGNSRAITSLPFNYSYGLSIIHTHLSVGGSIAFTDASMLESRFWDFYLSSKITHMGGVPYSYSIMNRFLPKLFQNSSLRQLTQAGGKLSADLVKKFATSSTERGIQFFVMYGQTEATARMSYITQAELLARPTSIGRPIPGGKFRLIDETGNQINSPDSEGELIYEGKNVCMGYAQSSEDLLKGDLNNGVLKTGDLAKIDENGFFYLTGRIKRIAKIYGVRINLEQIEDFLNEKVIESAVISNDETITIFHTVACESTSLIRQVSEFAHLRESIIKTRYIPFLPRTVSNKIDYAALSKVTENE